MIVSNTTVPPPLCVKLEGTLIHTHLLWESVLLMLARKPWLVGMPFLWMLSGRARLRAEIERRAPIDPVLLPYDERVLSFLTEQKASGRALILITGSSRLTGQCIADHLGLFDQVIASGQDVPSGDHSDPPVFKRENSHWRSLVSALRPYQWCKNLLAFVPIITSNQLTDRHGWLAAFWVFVAFSATASGVYVFNDLMDLPADRAHPRKRKRPFASGSLPLAMGIAMAPVLMGIGFGIAVAMGVWPSILLYAATSILYTFRLKELPLVDVFTLAFLYLIRLYAGGMTTGHIVSMWLLGFSAFLFLALALIKRATELSDAVEAGRKIARRGYAATDLPVLMLMGVTSSFASSTLLTLYVQSPEVAARYSSPITLWALVPLLLFWQLRLWLSATRGTMHDDPIIYAARDGVSWLIFFLVLATVIGANRS